MGSQSSKKNVVTDSMTEDDSGSYNLINIHAPTANLGFSLVLGLVVVVGLYRVYKCFRRAKWCWPGGGESKERGRPVVPPSATIDMMGFHGQAAPKQLAVYRGGDAKNAFW